MEKKDNRKGNRHRPGYSTEYMRIWRARKKAEAASSKAIRLETIKES